MYFCPLIQAELLSFVFGLGVGDCRRWAGYCECWVAADAVQPAVGISTVVAGCSTRLSSCSPVSLESTLPTLVPLTGEAALMRVACQNRLCAFS